MLSPADGREWPKGARLTPHKVSDTLTAGPPHAPHDPPKGGLFASRGWRAVLCSLRPTQARAWAHPGCLGSSEHARTRSKNRIRVRKGYGETRTRTGDTTIFSRVLYQLSYLAAVDLRPGRCYRLDGRASGRSGGRGRRRTGACARLSAPLALPVRRYAPCSQASRYGSGSIVCPPGAYQPPTHISKCR